MNHLCDLPVHLLGTLYSDWLDLRSLLALDSASCSAASRNAYLEVVGSSAFCYRAPDARSLKIIGMKWFVDRNAKIDRLWLDRSCDLGLTTALLHTCGDSLKAFRIYNFQEGLMLTAVTGLLSFASSRLEALGIYAFGVVDCVALGTLLATCAETLTRLELGSLGSVQCPHFPSLQMLHLRYCKASTETLCKLISASPNLRSFQCDDMQGSDACLDALADHCPLLQVLSYEKGNPDDVSALVHLLDCCPGIEAVDISSIEEGGNPSARDAHIAAIMQHCKNLKVFAAGTDSETIVGISDAAALAVATRVQDLRHLRLVGCDFSSDAPLKALAQNCQNLRSFDLQWSSAAVHNDYQVDDALEELVSNLKNVTELRFLSWGVGDDVLEAIAANCPQLQCLALPCCDGYTEFGIAALARGCTALRTLRINEDDDNFPPVAILLWQALRPGLEFHYWDDYHSFWDAVDDIDRKDLVIW